MTWSKDMRIFDDFDIGPQYDEHYDADYPFDPYEEDNNDFSDYADYARPYACEFNDDLVY